MSKKISPERQGLYYMGLGLTVIGFIVFLSSFFVGFSGMDMGFGMPTFFKRGLVGMICMIIGSILMNIGAKGAAGSGLILDPEKAREDLKPYSSAAGGMVNDLLEEVKIDKRKKEDIKEIIKIRCRGCGELNEEDSNFCKKCGERI